MGPRQHGGSGKFALVAFLPMPWAHCILDPALQVLSALTPCSYAAVTHWYLFAFHSSDLYHRSSIYSPLQSLHPAHRSSATLMCMQHDLFIQVSLWRMSCYSLPPSVNAISPQYGCGNLSLFKSPFAFSAAAVWVILLQSAKSGL